MSTKKAATKTEVAKTEEKPVTNWGDYSEYTDAPSKEEMLIPFLSILQPMSPIVTDGEVPGVKPGLFLNSVTGEIYDPSPGVPFQPVHFERLFVEWIPREEGGGIDNRYAVDDPFIEKLRAQNNNSVVGLKNGKNDILETVYVYGNILSEDGKEVEGFAVMPVKSTSLKPLRAWRTAMQMVKGKPPVFAFRCLLTNTREKNESGTWWQLKVNPLTPGSWKNSMIDPETERELLEAGRDLLEMVRSGEAQADFNNEAAASPAKDNDGDPF